MALTLDDCALVCSGNGEVVDATSIWPKVNDMERTSKRRALAPWVYGMVAGLAFLFEPALYGMKGLDLAVAMLIASGCYIAGNLLDGHLSGKRGLAARVLCDIVGFGVFVASWDVLNMGGVSAVLALVGLACAAWAVNSRPASRQR